MCVALRLHPHDNYSCATLYTVPLQKGPMGGAPYIGSRLGDEPIFKASVSHLDAKECPGKLPTISS